jgi:REP element-mobilizing transposase RayT
MGYDRVMARPLRIDIENGLYHVTSRGWERRVMVRNDADCQHWLELLDRVAVRCGWRVFAWVLMTNHFHLYLRTPEPNLRRTRNMPALKGNAVKHFLTRKKAYERIVAEFVRIRNARKSSEFSRIWLRRCFTALPERAKQNSLGVCSALSGLCGFVDSPPGASLAAHAASLCPRLICSAPSGQCPSLHVNRRAPRKIQPRTLPPDEPNSLVPSADE